MQRSHLAAVWRLAPVTSLLRWPTGCRSVWTDTPSNDETLSFYDSTVEEYARQPLAKLTLRHMLESGRDAWYDSSKVLDSARFAHEELPKRLARRLLDLQLLPHLVVSNPHIERVYLAYYHAFKTIIATRAPVDMAENDRFSALLRRLVDEHAPMLDALASGLREIRRKPLVGSHLQLDGFLEAMLRSRISRRVLAEQHINITNSRRGYIGIVNTQLSLADAVDFAAGRCRQVCMETFGAAPEVLVSGDTALAVPYIPAHIDYMLYEMLKNAARAVVERHHRPLRLHAAAAGDGGCMPPIRVRICGGGEDVTLRVSDQGGGIPRSDLSRVWEFGWTTLEQRQGLSGEESRGEGLGLDNINGTGPAQGFGAAWTQAEGGGGGTGRYRMAGLGFGLPLSRLYARYFGGDLRLVSMAGYGVDAFLALKRLEGREWLEAEEAPPSEVLGVGAGFGAVPRRKG